MESSSLGNPYSSTEKVRSYIETILDPLINYMQQNSLWSIMPDARKGVDTFCKSLDDDYHLTTKEWISFFFAKAGYDLALLDFIPSIHHEQCVQAMADAGKEIILPLIPRMAVTPKVYAVGVRQTPSSILTILQKNDQLKFDQDALDYLCLEALKQDINIQNIQEILSKMTDHAIIQLISDNWRVIKFIDPTCTKIFQNINRGMIDDRCKQAIAADWTEIKYAPKSIINTLSPIDICEAIKKSAKLMEPFSDIPIQFRTKEVCLKHISYSAVNQQAVISLMSDEKERPPFFTKDDYAECCEKYIKLRNARLYDIPIENRTPSVCLTAVKTDWINVRFIPDSEPNKYKESFLSAIKFSKKHALLHIPYDVLLKIKDDVSEILFNPNNKKDNLSEKDCYDLCKIKSEPIKLLFKLYPQHMLKVLSIDSVSNFMSLLNKNKKLAYMAASIKEVQSMIFNQANDTFLEEIANNYPTVAKLLSQHSGINYKFVQKTGLSSLGDQCIELLIIGSLNKERPLQNHNTRREGIEKFVAMFTPDGLKQWLINPENQQNMNEGTVLNRLYNTIAGEKSESLSKEEEERLSSFFKKKTKAFFKLVSKAINLDDLNNKIRILFDNNELILSELDFKILKKYTALLTPTEGPRNKNAATFLIEKILYKIARNQNGIFPELTYNETLEEWELQVEGKKEPISLLLKHANLSHLELNDDAIIEIARQHEKELGLSKIELTPVNIFNAIIKRYTANDFYSNTIKDEFYKIMNQFSRGDLSGEKQVKGDLFIYVCLLSIAMNRRISSLQESPKTEEQASDLYTGHLTRKEVLDDKNLTERRLGEQELKQLTSTSKPGGSFSKSKHQFTIFYNSPPIQDLAKISEHPNEKEVLITPGYTAVYLPESDNKTIHAVLRNKPEKQEKNYFTDLSLRVAYEHYLKKPFNQTPDDRKVNNITIARPNHGLAHTYRVMQYSDYVIEYFKNHAADPKFKNFCENISDEEREFIKMALAFSVTGRESEASWSKQKDLYYEFRKNSANNFQKFCKDNLLETIKTDKEKETKEMIERYTDLILHLNEPDKFKLDSNDPTRHFVEIIMSFSHTLDLPRCYGISTYCKSMEQYTGIIEESEYQKHDLNELEKFACAYIKKMGDSLLFNKSSTGEFNSVLLQYREPFDLYSTSIKQCENVTCDYQVQFKGKNPAHPQQLPSVNSMPPTKKI